MVGPLRAPHTHAGRATAPSPTHNNATMITHSLKSTTPATKEKRYRARSSERASARVGALGRGQFSFLADQPRGDPSFLCSVSRRSLAGLVRRVRHLLHNRLLRRVHDGRGGHHLLDDGLVHDRLGDLVDDGLGDLNFRFKKREAQSEGKGVFVCASVEGRRDVGNGRRSGERGERCYSERWRDLNIL